MRRYYAGADACPWARVPAQQEYRLSLTRESALVFEVMIWRQARWAPSPIVLGVVFPRDGS
jgi:hypothetical protein